MDTSSTSEGESAVTAGASVAGLRSPCGGAFGVRSASEAQVGWGSTAGAGAGSRGVRCNAFELYRWTPDQVQGMVFFIFLVGTLSQAYRVDEFVARGQRKDLGVCERCGGTFEPGSCAESDCPLKGR